MVFCLVSSVVKFCPEMLAAGMSNRTCSQKAINTALVYDVDGANLCGGNGVDSATDTIRKKSTYGTHCISTRVDTAVTDHLVI